MGATANRVVKQIVKETLLVIGAGVFLAWIIAVMVDMHLFAGGMEDAAVLLGVPLILMTVGALALAAGMTGDARRSRRRPQI